MFRALIASIGLLVVASYAVKGDLSLYGIAYKLWSVILFAWILGGILDAAFLSFYDEAVKRLATENAK